MYEDNGKQTLITIAYTGAGVVDEFTSERVIDGGIAYEKGDVWLSIPFELVADIHTFITR